MNGRHTLVVGASIVDIQTTPLRVLKGSARVVTEPGTYPVVAFD
jgi:hypothetical protein